MVDYTRLAATAERLINKNGREVTFVKKSTTPLDPTKPWKGSSTSATETTLVRRAVFVPPNQVRIFGLSALGEATQFVDMIAFCEQIAIVFPDENDLKEYQTLRDGSINWNIMALQLLKPADKQILAFIGTRR
jgi:hypothetical protein